MGLYGFVPGRKWIWGTTAKLLKGGHIGYFIGDYYRGDYGGY